MGMYKAGEDRRPLLEKLCAALLQSFRGQHSEKMKGSARVIKRPTTVSTQSKRGQGPNHHVEVLVDWCC